jgi:hypothetical protein
VGAESGWLLLLLPLLLQKMAVIKAKAWMYSTC